jgi:hypothetical protein
LEIQKRKQQDSTPLACAPIPRPPLLPSPETPGRNRRPLSNRSEVDSAKAQPPVQARFPRHFLPGKDNRRGFEWKTGLTSLALSLRGRVGGGGGGGGHGHGRVKRESLGRAGGLQTPARPRLSADGRPHAPPIPPRMALLNLFAAPMSGGLR